MKRVAIAVLVLAGTLALLAFPILVEAQESVNMTLVGRNGIGPSHAVFVYGQYMVMGNGAYVEVIEIRGTRPYLVKKSRLLLPDVVKDIYVAGQTAYVACDHAGLQLVDITNPAAPMVVGSVSVEGRAEAVFIFGDIASVAGGTGGLSLFNVANPRAPYALGRYTSNNTPIHDVWVDVWGVKSVAFAAADTAGLWAIDVTDANQPARLDSIHLKGVAKRVYLSRSIAYTAMGSQGLTQVNTADPTRLAVYRFWKPDGDYDITDVFVRSSTAYLTDARFGVRVLDVTDGPVEVGRLYTKGTAERITLNPSSTAFVADGGGGLLMLDVFTPTPSRVDSIATGDMANDIAVRGNAVYVAGGKSGLWVLDRRTTSLTDIQAVVRVDTMRYCEGVAVKDTLLLVSNGRNGVKVMSVRNPFEPVMLTNIRVPNAAHGVDFDGNRAIVAGGTAGVHIFNILDPKRPTDLGTVSLGAMSAMRVKVDALRHVAYVATNASVHVIDLDAKTMIATCPGSSNSTAADLSENANTLTVSDGVNGVLVYDVSNPGSPRAIQGMAYNTPGTAMDVRVQGNAAVVADGEGTVRILDMSRSPIEVGFAHTGGSSLGLDIAGDTVAVADAEAGVYFYRTNFAGTLSLQQTALNFGSVVIGKSRVLHLTVRNNGTRIVQVSNVSSGTGLFASGASSAFSIYPGDSYTFPVVFTPNSLQEITDVLTLESDASNPQISVAVRGSGVQVTPLSVYAPDVHTYILYHMDRTVADTLVPDESLYGVLDGRNLGGTIQSADLSRFGQSMRFHAQDGVQVKLDSANVLPPSDGFTIDTWFRLETGQTGKKVIFKFGLTNGRSLFELGIDDIRSGKRGLYGLTMPSTNDTLEVVSDSTRALRLEEWYHAALVYRPDNRLVLYLNGDALDTVEVAVSIPSTSLLRMTLGNAGEENGIDGALDEFRLSGIARDPWEFNVSTGRIRLTAETLNFGNILIPYSRTLALTVWNTGAGQLWVDSLKTTNPRFQVIPASFILPSGGAQMVWVTFTPTDAGGSNAFLNVYSKDPNTPVRTLVLTGNGFLKGVPGSYAADVYTVGLWHMDWVKGDTAITDTSANALTGFLSRSGVTRNSLFTRYGAGSLYFAAGSNGWVRIPNHPILEITNLPFSIETWFRMAAKPATGDYAVLARRGGGNGCQMEILYGDSVASGRGLVARVYGSNGVPYTLLGPADTTMNTGSWYHVALTWDKATLRLFVNGLRADSVFFAGSLRSSSRDIAVGSHYGRNHGFTGYLDEMRVSSTARLSWEFNVMGPKLYTVTETVVFDQILLGETSTGGFTLQNLGDQPLVVSGMTWRNRVFSISPNALQVPMGSSALVQVTFTPTAIGTVRDTVTVLSNDPTHPSYQIPVLATVIDYRSKIAYAVDDYTVALYHFDETSGKVLDAQANQHDGDLVGGAERITAGYFGGAVRLNGTSGYVSIPSANDLVLNLETSSYTIECFFRTDTLSQSLFFKDPSGGVEKPNTGLSIDNHGRLVWAGFGTASLWVADHAWHHVALVYDHLARTGSLYLDGSLLFQQNWIPEQTDTKTLGALLIGAREVTVGTLANFFEGDIDEFRISDKARKPWEFLFARSGIDVGWQANPFAGNTLQVTVAVPSDTSSKTVTLAYRQTGESAYTSLTAGAVDQTRTTYRAVIPASDVTKRGIELYVQKASARGTATQPVYDPENKPISIPVQFAGLSGDTLKARRYAMVSIPAALKKSNVGDVLSDDLGAYDPYTWRCFTWKDTNYVEYSDTLGNYDRAEFNLTSGKAVWVISAQARTFDADSGVSVSSSGSYAIAVKPQWNMVASPYLFPVAWDDCALSDAMDAGNLYAYDGTGYRLDWPTLEPWKGYWLYNPKVSQAALYVPPRKATGTGTPKRGLLKDLQNGEWLWKISAETPDAKDLDNFLGVRSQAEETMDRFDRAEPPPIGDFVSLFVNRPDWKDAPHTLAADIRAPGQPGYIWSVTLKSQLVRQSIALRWTLWKTLPDGWTTVLVDEDEGVAVPLLEQESYAVQTGAKAPNLRRFTVLAGPPEFVQKQSSIPVQPVEFALSQNYPNPFNPSTTVEYALPKNGRVRLTLYNLLGQRIRTLLDQDQKKGYHKVVWDGDNDRGLRASSGIYIYRLEFLDRVAVRKLVLVK